LHDIKICSIYSESLLMGRDSVDSHGHKLSEGVVPAKAYCIRHRTRGMSKLK